MIVDINVGLGHYPFRSLRHNTAGAMLALMDRNGIDLAVVTSLAGVFYRDVHRGNEELIAEIRPHGRRFVPVATINPRYVGWERDLAECVETWKMKAVQLTPEHHGYTLADEHGRAALEKIAGYGVPVLLRQRFEDRRQRHAWDKAEDISLIALLEAAKAHPTLKFLLPDWLVPDGARLAAAGLKGRCLFDLSRMQVVFRKEVLGLLDKLGGDSVAFGSHAPFDYVAPSLIKLANVKELRPAHYDAVASGNAVKFLGLSV